VSDGRQSSCALCLAVVPASVIVGAGAAGIVAAIFASERSSVTVIERTSDGGRKILISGGGRCNILPVALEPAQSGDYRIEVIRNTAYCDPGVIYVLTVTVR